MAGKKTAYCGLAFVVPEHAVAMTSRKTGKIQSFGSHQISSKTEYKHAGAGCSTKFTKTHKSGGFVDGRNGNQGYKEEVSYKSSFKVNDKLHGCNTRYETEVKHKKVTSYTKPSKSSGGVKYGKVGTCTKPSKSSGGGKLKRVGTCTTCSSKGSGGVKFKMVTTYTNPSKSSGGSGGYFHF